MELKVNDVQLPAPITFNYEELKQELLAKVSVYETMIYSEDQIKLAKADRANLNRLKKALNDERIRREKEYMLPFNTFKKQVNEIIRIIDKPCAVIDKQVKEYEEQQREEKMEAIKAYWNDKQSIFDEDDLIKILDQKWLNASVSMKAIQDSIDTRIAEIDKDLAVIRNLPAFAFEAEQMYLQTLDLGRAISGAHRLQEMAEKKAAIEAEKAQPKPEVKQPEADQTDIFRQWIGFQAYLTVGEAKALGAWMKAMGIQYKAI